MKVTLLDVATQKDALYKLATLVEKSLTHPLVRETAFQIVRNCPSRDDMAELNAIYEAIKHGDPEVPGLESGFRYCSDPRSTDYFTTAYRSLEMAQRGGGSGDCLPTTTLVLKRGSQDIFIPTSLKDIQIGDVILGDGVWTTVVNKWDKGLKKLLGLTLNNSTQLRCTYTHKLLVVPKFHPREHAIIVNASDIKVGDDLLSSNRMLLELPMNKRPDLPIYKTHTPGLLTRVSEKADLYYDYTIDIATDSGVFYLPETNVITKNCDDFTVLIASIAASIGFKVGLRGWGSEKEFVHVYPVVALPKHGPFTSVVALDATVPRAVPGWEPNGGVSLTAWLD